jgi:hypothetical protein
VPASAGGGRTLRRAVVRGLAVAALPLTALRAYRHPDVIVQTVPGLTPRMVLTLRRPGLDRVPSVAAVLATLAKASVNQLDTSPGRSEPDGPT